MTWRAVFKCSDPVLMIRDTDINACLEARAIIVNPDSRTQGRDARQIAAAIAQLGPNGI